MRLLSQIRTRLSPQQRQWLRKMGTPFVSLASRSDLNMLALKHATDKSYHGYTSIYQQLFEPLRDRRLNILEIGIGGETDERAGGASLRMWKEYFPKASIYGIDIVDKSALDEDRIKTFKGSQNDPEFLRSVAARIGEAHIIIDDGSHGNEHVITAFRTLFPLLAKGGIYAIEDVHTSYQAKYGGTLQPDDQTPTSISMLKGHIDGLHHSFIPERSPTEFDLQIQSIHFYTKLAVIMKRP